MGTRQKPAGPARRGSGDSSLRGGGSGRGCFWTTVGFTCAWTLCLILAHMYKGDRLSRVNQTCVDLSELFFIPSVVGLVALLRSKSDWLAVGSACVLFAVPLALAGGDAVFAGVAWVAVVAVYLGWLAAFKRDVVESTAFATVLCILTAVLLPLTQVLTADGGAGGQGTRP